MSLIYNPFVGLRAFESDESLLFFGRQQQVLELLQHLHQHHFVAIIGSSGSGKSSLIRAGLIPRLKAGYLIEDRDEWLLTDMKPGQSPVYNLAKKIAAAVKPDGGEEAAQELLNIINDNGADGLIEYLQPAIKNNVNVFLLVDQFEELFRFSIDEKSGFRKNEAIDFVNILLDITQQVTLPIYVVITMRSDFIGDCAQFFGLPETMNESQYLVPRLTRTQLKSVITDPLALSTAGIEQTLVNQLLNDTGDNPDQLPVLQHALMRTWEVWHAENTNRKINLGDYRKTGTMHAALSQHAEEAYTELGSEKLQHICELVFKALTDKKSDARGVRRPQTFATLLQLTKASDEELKKVINTFRTNGRTFLMPPANIELTPKTVIDISHESLMRVWTRLVQWVEEESESEQIYLRLSEAASLYKQQRGGLWRNPELNIALQWKEKNNPNEVWARQINNSYQDAINFLEQSNNRYQQELLEEEAEQKSRLRRARTVAAVISVIAVISIVLFVYAHNKQQESKVSEQRAISSESKAIKSEQKAKLEEGNAIAAKNLADSNRFNAERFAYSALQQKTRADSLLGITNTALLEERNSKMAIAAANRSIEEQKNQLKSTNDSLRISDSVSKINKLAAQQKGKSSDSLAALSQSLYDAKSAIDELEQNHLPQSKEKVIRAYELNRDNNGPVLNNTIYDALNKYWASSIHNGNEYNVHSEPVRSIAVIPNTNTIISGDENGIIDIAVNENGMLHHKNAFSVKANIRSLAVSPDGKKLAVISATGTGYTFNINADYTLAPSYTFSFQGSGKKILFENDKGMLVLTSEGILKFTITDALIRTRMLLQAADYTAIYVGSKGDIYIAKRNTGILVYHNNDDIANQKPAKTFSWNSARDYITSLTADDNEAYVIAGTYQGYIQAFASDGNDSYSIGKIHQSAVNDIVLGKLPGNINQLCSAGADQTVKLTNVGFITNKKIKQTESIILPGHSKWVYGITYNKDHSYLFSCGEDGKVIAWHSSMEDLYNTINH